MVWSIWDFLLYSLIGKGNKRFKSDMVIGDTIGFRGPYGNCFPLDKMKGKNIVFLGMGIGLASVRSVIWNCLDLRGQFKEITIIIGIKFTLPELTNLGFPFEHIYTTLENRMKCGLGKCGRCNIGNVYVCKDGPVFTAEEVQQLPDDF